jgi:hypothetical protein
MAFGAPDACCCRSILARARAALLPRVACTTMGPGWWRGGRLPPSEMQDGHPQLRAPATAPWTARCTRNNELFVCTACPMTALIRFGLAGARGTMVSPCSAAAHVKRTATVDSKQWLRRGATVPLLTYLQASPSSQPLGNCAMRGQGERVQCSASQSLRQHASIEPNGALLQLPARSHSCGVCLKTRSRLLVLSITSSCIPCQKEGTAV